MLLLVSMYTSTAACNPLLGLPWVPSYTLDVTKPKRLLIRRSCPYFLYIHYTVYIRLTAGYRSRLTMRKLNFIIKLLCAFTDEDFTEKLMVTN